MRRRTSSTWCVPRNSLSCGKRCIGGGCGIKLIGDYHTHTHWSHGAGSVEANVQAARRAGLERLAITDHGPAMLPWLRVPGAGALAEVKSELEHLQRVHGDISLAAGVEANVITPDGDLDVPRQILRELDIVLAGLHILISPRRRSLGLVFGNLAWKRLGRRQAARIRVMNTKALLEAIRRYPIDILTHPGLGLPVDTRELSRGCARRGTALEINCAHAVELEGFVRAALKEGADFVISSDAHRPEQVGRFEEGIRVAEKVGLPEERILNSEAGAARAAIGPWPCRM